MCGQGHAAMCHAGVCVGVGPDKPGAYAEFIAVKGHGLHRLPKGVSLEEGALVEPLAVAYHAVCLAGLSRDDDVLVMGGGPIGAAVTLFARHAGVRNIVVSEPNAVRRDYARNFGATATVDPKDGDLGALAAKHLGGLPSVVIECVGNPGRINDALGAVRKKGRVVIPGVCMQEDRFMPVVGIMKELSLQFSQTSTDSDFEAVLNLVAKKEIEAEKLHTRTIALTEVGEVFESLAGDPMQVKVMIEPSARP
jgi:(R,R)-butanediol dehydrogenase/meso-butanediol dehydrogenase/diacetyl reductase